MLLLLLVILSCYCAGSYGQYKEVCYGRDLTISLGETPLLHFRREWFFLPVKPGINRTPVKDRVRVATENGTSLDPHYEISSDKFIIRDVTERDNGFFSYSTLAHFTLFRVAVKDCSSKVTKQFGSDYYFIFPSNAYYLEFTPLVNSNSPQPQVLWNRIDPLLGKLQEGGRGRMVDDKWTMNKLTYWYEGYYTFRDHNHKMVSRNRMQIEERWQSHNDKVQGEELRISLEMDAALFHMTFEADADHSEKVLLMRAGELQRHKTCEMFQSRVYKCRMLKLEGPTLQMVMEDLQPSDSGRYEFRDGKDRLALVVTLTVAERYPSYLRYIGVAVGILALVICCCYVRKRCCKTTRKNRSVPDTEAAPDVPVYYHDDNTQPSTSAHPTPSPSHGPTYSYPLHPQEPASTYQPPLVPGAEDPPTSSTQPEDNHMDDPPVYDSLFSPGSEPQFELRGATFPSAPPLSSDTPYSDVYTSDKLNFL